MTDTGLFGFVIGLVTGLFLGAIVAYMFEDALRGPIMRCYDDWLGLKREVSPLKEILADEAEHRE